MAVTQRGHEGMKIHTVLSIQCHAEQLWPGILETRMSNGSFSSAQFDSCLVSKKHAEAYFNYKLLTLLAQAYY